MLRTLSFGFASGAAGGAANVAFLVAAGLIGLPAMLGLGLPSFAQAGFLYKQLVWGGLWGLVMTLPFAPTNWLLRGLLFGIAATVVTLFVFFPLATTTSGGPGIAGLNIGPLMPVYVLVADVVWGLVASRVYEEMRWKNA